MTKNRVFTLGAIRRLLACSTRFQMLLTMLLFKQRGGVSRRLPSSSKQGEISYAQARRIVRAASRTGGPPPPEPHSASRRMGRPHFGNSIVDRHDQGRNLRGSDVGVRQLRGSSRDRNV